MTLKAMIVTAVCVPFWIVLFPLAVIGGGAALVILAVGTELSHLLAGTSGQGIDHSAARKLALRICGYPSGATAQGRYASLGRYSSLGR